MPTQDQPVPDAGVPVASVGVKKRLTVGLEILSRILLSAIVGAFLNPLFETVIGVCLALLLIAASKIASSINPTPVTNGPTEDLTGMLVFLPAYFFIPTASVPGAVGAILANELRRPRWLMLCMLLVVSVGQVLAISHLYYRDTSIMEHADLFLVLGVIIWIGTYLTTIVVRRLGRNEK